MENWQRNTISFTANNETMKWSNPDFAACNSPQTIPVLTILFGSTIPWTARVAEHGGIFCFINSQGCVRLQLTMDWRFKFQQTDRVQPAAHVQIQHEDLLQVTNGG